MRDENKSRIDQRREEERRGRKEERKREEEKKKKEELWEDGKKYRGRGGDEAERETDSQNAGAGACV